jgi:hypothetical protein
MELAELGTTGYYVSQPCGTLCPSGIEAQEVCNVSQPISLVDGMRSTSAAAATAVGSAPPAFVLGCGCPQSALMNVERSALGLLQMDVDGWGGALLVSVVVVVALLPLAGYAARAVYPRYPFEPWAATRERVAAAHGAARFAFVATVAVLGVLLAIDWDYAAHANLSAEPLDVGICTYHGMFCEPTLHTHYVRRPSNAYSNVVYLWVGLFIIDGQPALSRGASGAYRACDALFGCAIVALAGVSFLWHARNLNNPVHYFDLGTMESVIVYLQFRCAGLVLQAWTARSGRGPGRGCYAATPQRAATLARNLVATAFVAFAAFQLELNMHRARAGAFDWFFPSGRARAGAPDEPSVGEVAALWGLPAVFACVLPPAALAVGSLGSLPLLALALASLSLGWSLHILERFALDMFCLPLGGIVGFVTSPTGVFHALTGVAILAFYLYVNSLERALAINTRACRNS